MQNSLNWEDLQFFLALYRRGSLSAAGRELGVYPSTVGRRLDALEQALGAKLFQRAPEGFVPTASAEEILEASEIIERQSHLIAERLSGRSAELKGRVRVAVTEQIAEYFLCSELPGFQQAHPEIDVELLTSVSFSDLARGQAEVALRFAHPDAGAPVATIDSETITARAISRIGIRVYVSKRYLERTGKSVNDDLESFDVVMPVEKWLPGSEWMQQHMSRCPVALRSDGMSTIMAAVRNGMGASALPLFMAGRSGEFVALAAPGVVAVRTAWVLVPRDLRRVARVRAFVGFLTEVMGENETLFAGK